MVKLDLMKKPIFIIEQHRESPTPGAIGHWCNGSTEDSDSADIGSIPLCPAIYPRSSME